MKYVLAIDQSTQGTKALLFDEAGAIVCRADRVHRQIINEKGWVSHDPDEIFENVLNACRDVVQKGKICADNIVCMGISNQRETTLVWDKSTGRPLCDAIVWQCSRAAEICKSVAAGYSEKIRQCTGIPVSPYFPAAKMAWILENVPGAKEKELCFGTVDTWLVYKLTGEYKTDYSNASRTQLFNITSLQWDEDICRAFGLDAEQLPQVCDSDSVFGDTDLGGLLTKKIPICGVLGDSHAALFGQGCLESGMAKATYGTGSSVMMNVGTSPVFSSHGLVTSLAWKVGGVANYVLEGNINYTGAVISWLKDDVKLISSAGETEALARAANPDDTTYLVPAFTGLGAPYWNNSARAMFCGITRLTGRNEIVRASLDCIAYQITDIVRSMEQDTGRRLKELRTDGAPTRNGYLMQFQSDILSTKVEVSQFEEMSACGVAFLAGMSCGIYDANVLHNVGRSVHRPQMADEVTKEKYRGWQNAVRMVLT